MHVILLPFPSLGHINSLLAIAKLLQFHGFTIVVVVTEEMATKFSNSEDDDGGGCIRYVGIPSVGFKEAAKMDSSWVIAPYIAIMRSMRHGFENLLQRDYAASSSSSISCTASPPVPRVSCCIIADCFVTWSQQVAAQFGIPGFSFHSSNAHTMAAYLHIDALVAQGICPVRKDDDGTAEQWLHRRVDTIPGLPSLRVADLPRSMQVRPDFVREVVEGARKAEKGVIMNTVYEIEERAIEALMKEVRVHPIGPLLLQLDMATEEKQRKKSESDMARKSRGMESSKSSRKEAAEWEEDEGCLEWLDRREASSVVYVSFGSLAKADKEQMEELAKGLEMSGEAFVWVVRPDTIAEQNPLPDGFIERTTHRGLLVSWAPQLQVLAHPSVSAFLTHCGWNSITENLCTGSHPMLCWPQIAEQRLNATTVVEEWGAGIHLLQPDLVERQHGLAPSSSMVTSQTVATCIVQIMRGEAGKRLKSRTRELKQTISQSVRPGGRSHAFLASLLQAIRQAPPRANCSLT